MISQNLELYLESCKEKNLDESSLYSYRHYLEKWLHWLENHAGQDARNTVQSFLSGEFIREQTRKSVWRDIKIYYRWLALHGLEIDWTENLHLRFAPAPDYPTLSTDEFEKIISSIPDSWPGRRNVALYSLIFYTGARLGAIRLLKVKDVCTERQGIYIHILTKLNHEHYLDLPKIAADRLTQWLYEIDRNPDQYVFPRSTDRRLPLNPDQVSNVWPRYAKRAGIDKRCWVHGLRHSFATICCHAGVDLIVLQDLMGHANINQTAQYVYRSRDRRKDALKKVFG